MKKQYITPISADLAITTETELNATSQSIISEDYGLDYGGIDEDGTLVPGARCYHDVWEEESDEY